MKNWLSISTKTLAYITLLLVVSTFSSCSVSEFDTENLMHPPKLSAQQEEIYNALEDFCGPDMQLIYPKDGDYRSAFVMFDINNDGFEEVFAFSTVNYQTSPRLNMIVFKEDRWVVDSSVPIASSEVDKIVFAKLINHSYYDIIVGCNAQGKLDKELMIFNYKDNQLSKLYPLSLPYSEFAIFDLTGDSLNDIFVIFDSVYNSQPLVSLISKTPPEDPLSDIQRVGRTHLCNLSGPATEYLNIQPSKLPNGNMAVFIDLARKENQYYTEIVALEGENMVNKTFKSDEILDIASDDSDNPNPQYVQEVVPGYNFLQETYRSKPIPSLDVNNDGLLEVPYTTPMPGYFIEDVYGKKMFLTQYKMLNEHLSNDGKQTVGFDTVVSRFEPDELPFAFAFPDRWIDNVTVKKHQTKDEWIFFQYKETLKDASTPILEIKAYNQDAFKDKFEIDGLIYASSFNGNDYYAKLYSPLDDPVIIKEDKENLNQDSESLYLSEYEFLSNFLILK